MARQRYTEGYRSRACLDSESDRLLERTCARLGLDPPVSRNAGGLSGVRLGPAIDVGDPDQVASDDPSSGSGARRPGNGHGAVGDRILHNLFETRTKTRQQRVLESGKMAAVFAELEEAEERVIIWGGFAEMLREFNNSFTGGDMLASPDVLYVIQQEIEIGHSKMSIAKRTIASYGATRPDPGDQVGGGVTADEHRRMLLMHEERQRARLEQERLERLERDRLERDRLEQRHTHPVATQDGQAGPRRAVGWEDVVPAVFDDGLTDEQLREKRLRELRGGRHDALMHAWDPDDGEESSSGPGTPPSP